MTSSLDRLGRAAARHPWRVIAAWVLLAIAVTGGTLAVGRDLDDDTQVPGLDSQEAIDLLDAAGVDDAGITAQVVLAPRGAATFADPALRDEVERVRSDLAELPNVIDVSDPYASGAIAPDGRVALVRLQYPALPELDRSDLDRLQDALADARTGALLVEAGGELFFDFEQPETSAGEIAGLGVAVAVLLLAFGSVVAAGLPIGTALLGLVIGIGSLGLVAHVVDVPAFATVMASMVGLGAGIDYALFVVTRHREQLAAGADVVESVGAATATAGRSVLFAGGTVVVSILGLAVAGLPFLTAAAIAISLVVLVMVAGALTLLPALLGLAGRGIDRWRVHRRDHGAASRRWKRWALHVTRHPMPYALASTVVLVALAAPTAALRLGVPDEGTLPPSRTERRAYDLVADAFGPGANGPLLVAVDLGGDPSLVDPLASAIAADPGIASVAPPEVTADATVAAIVAVPTTAPQDRATRATVERLRADVFPAVLAGTGATAHVGGQTANFSDLSDRVQQRLPWFVLTVIALSFVLLTVVFRSLVVAVKAALLNLLSIGAAYGVLVMVFQWEWGAGLIGLESAVPIVSFIPMLMFAIVFGLSMDYEVFLLSRVREHYDRTGDNATAVVDGLVGTARVITSAALIMVAVFLGFVFGDDPTVKMLGLGLATAIFVDATLVRMVLVPAAMTLMGDANWWVPAPLARVLPPAPVRDEAQLAPVAPAEPAEPVAVGGGR